MEHYTLTSINVIAMDAKKSIEFLGYDRKYDWHLWGYLLALFDNGIIDYQEYTKIKKHYRKYFKELSRNQS